MLRFLTNCSRFLVLFLVCLTNAAFAHNGDLSGFAGRINAVQFNQWTVPIFYGTSSGSSGIVLGGNGRVTLPDGTEFVPFKVGTPLRINDGSNSETVSPTGVGNCGEGRLQNQCAIAGTFGFSHGAGAATTVSSGTFGLQEAINYLLSTGGLVVVDGSWNGTTGMITSATGSSTVAIEDIRSGVPAYYVWVTSVYVLVGSNGGTADASVYPGATWFDRATAAATALGNNGTVLIPDSLASLAAYPSGTMSSGITFKFTGSGTFGFCTLTEGKFSKIVNNAALLKMNPAGSNCTGITHTVQATLQENDKTILSWVRVDCANQPGSTGITFTGGSAQNAFDHVSVQKCGTVAGGVGLFYQDQFGQLSDINLQQNYVNLKIYTTDAQPGVSSNTWTNLKTNTAISGVNMILQNSNTGGQTQAGNKFINHQCQNGTIACVAMFGGTSGFMNAEWDDAQPESNGGGAASIVIDGLTIKQAGAWYLKNAHATLNHVEFSDATADPIALIESNSYLTIVNPGAGGGQFAKLVQADSTSFVNPQGDWSVSGVVQNVTSYPSSISAGRGAMSGAPISGLDSSVPNAFTGDPLKPAFTSTTGTSSNAIALDSLYGAENTVTFAASAGSASSNEVAFPDCISSATGVTSNLLCSIIVTSTITGSFQLGGYLSGNTIGFKFGAPLLLYANQPQRVLMWTYGASAGTGIVLSAFPNDSAGATLKFTRLEGISCPTGAVGVASLQCAQQMAQVIQSGAVNPNSVRGFVSTLQSATDFTTANNTSLQTITGLSWTIPSVVYATKFSFACDLAYSQGTANVAVAFGIQAATTNPTNIFAVGTQQITVGPPSTKVDGTLATLATTTATSIVSGTPGATVTNYTVHLAGTIENPASTPNIFNVMTSTANGSDAVTVKRGSMCYPAQN